MKLDEKNKRREDIFPTFVDLKAAFDTKDRTVKMEKPEEHRSAQHINKYDKKHPGDSKSKSTNRTSV